MKKLIKTILVLVIYLAIVFIILWKSDVIEIKVLDHFKKPDEYINNNLSLEDRNLVIEKGKEDRYYYNQIDEDAKKVYDKILDSTEDLKTGIIEISFEENEFANILAQDNGIEILSEKYQQAVDALRYDHVELFYIDFTKMVLRTITYTQGYDVTYEVYLSIMEGENNYLQEEFSESEITPMLEKIDEKADQIISEAQGTDYQKIQYIHNWLIDNLEYDISQDADNIRNLKGALINQLVVCEGYAKSFKYLLDKLDIPCILVSGDAVNSEGKSESHMWNYVRINGTWYSFDVTWDDPILENTNKLPNKYRYRYFCQGDNINSNHTPNPQITHDGKIFEYPELYHKEQ